MISRSNRYERWDGSQEPFGRDAEDLFDRLAEDLFQGGDFDYALHRLMSRGWRDRQGRKLPGFEEMLERLRQKRLQQLKRYNLNDVFGNIRERLNDILRRERQGINERLEQAPESAKRVLQRITKKKLQELDRLPEDVGGAIRELNDYEFMDEGAAQAFQKLMEPRPGLGSRYAFYGSESLPLQEALSLMERLQGIEDLESALREGYQGRQLTPEQSAQLQQLLGSDARQAADQMSELASQLEKKGYVQRGRRGMELTPRGMRRIGQKALRDLYTRLKRDRFGDHPISVRGLGSERSDETKVYEFGDAFNLQVEQTLMNALRRDGPQRPIQLKTDDFEVYRSEFSAQSATVLMIDMSRSMPLRGYFYAAKKVALALDALIRSQFPRDFLQVIAFSGYARPVKSHQLAELTYNESIYGTNIQHGLMLARQFLNRHKTGNKQVIIVTDGEPTAHMEGQQAVFFYPPLPETFQKTLLEVQRCTREHIVINTFMLDNDYHLVSFVKQMTRMNGGRAFFASADRLGDYVLLDYVDRKRKASR